jgi:hypothetical protein
VRKLLVSITAIGICAFIAVPATAAILVTSAADLTGANSFRDSRDLVVTNGWTTANGGFKIDWIITFNGGTIQWTYQYTFTSDDGTGMTPNASHWIFEVSENFTSNDISDANFPTVGPQTFLADPDAPNSTSPGANKGKPNLPANIFGIKADSGSDEVADATFSFTSTRAPVWGDFYAKDGKHTGIVVTAWNTGIGTDPTAVTTDFTPWIPTPGTLPVLPSNIPQVIPEPTAAVVWGLGVFMCFCATVIQHRRRRLIARGGAKAGQATDQCHGFWHQRPLD